MSDKCPGCGAEIICDIGGFTWECGSYDIAGIFTQVKACKDRRDAARYRFIRDTMTKGIPCRNGITGWELYWNGAEGPTFDAAIDALIAERQAKTG